MATRKRTGNKQPADDPALKSATKAAAKQAETEAKTGDVATTKSPETHLRDNRDDSGVIGPS